MNIANDERIVEATTEVRPVSSSTGELVILERLFGESFIKLGELHRYTFELVDAFVNNAAERALRGIALGRKAWLFAGSQRPCSAPPGSNPLMK